MMLQKLLSISRYATIVFSISRYATIVFSISRYATIVFSLTGRRRQRFWIPKRYQISSRRHIRIGIIWSELSRKGTYVSNCIFVFFESRSPTEIRFHWISKPGTYAPATAPLHKIYNVLHTKETPQMLQTHLLSHL